MNRDWFRGRIVVVVTWKLFAALAAFLGTVTVLIAVIATMSGVFDRLDRADQNERLRSCQSVVAVVYSAAPQSLSLKALADHGFEDQKFKDAADQIDPTEYERLTKLAKSDPEEFLNECDRLTG